MTSIISNGSKWAGQAPDSIERLIEVLQTETLDPSFERYGNFCHASNDKDRAAGIVGAVRFFGNFLTVSHVFDIETDDQNIIAKLLAGIRVNQKTDRYIAARSGMKLPRRSLARVA